ncbi:hypothetical protein Pelo_15537 [Pelomyxa schiedti]|nr:hypothetical protein Pelo_15537 [Pelomyxa schiedti]
MVVTAVLRTMEQQMRTMMLDEIGRRRYVVDMARGLSHILSEHSGDVIKTLRQTSIKTRCSDAVSVRKCLHLHCITALSGKFGGRVPEQIASFVCELVFAHFPIDERRTCVPERFHQVLNWISRHQSESILVKKGSESLSQSNVVVGFVVERPFSSPLMPKSLQQTLPFVVIKFSLTLSGSSAIDTTLRVKSLSDFSGVLLNGQSRTQRVISTLQNLGIKIVLSNNVFGDAVSQLIHQSGMVAIEGVQENILDCILENGTIHALSCATELSPPFSELWRTMYVGTATSIREVNVAHMPVSIVAVRPGGNCLVPHTLMLAAPTESIGKTYKSAVCSAIRAALAWSEENEPSSTFVRDETAHCSRDIESLEQEPQPPLPPPALTHSFAEVEVQVLRLPPPQTSLPVVVITTPSCTQQQLHCNDSYDNYRGHPTLQEEEEPQMLFSVAGGASSEAALHILFNRLAAKSTTISLKNAFSCLASGLLHIPQTLSSCGNLTQAHSRNNTWLRLNELLQAHCSGHQRAGMLLSLPKSPTEPWCQVVDDMSEFGVLEPLSTKYYLFVNSITALIRILWIGGVVSGRRKKV